MNVKITRDDGETVEIIRINKEQQKLLYYKLINISLTLTFKDFMEMKDIYIFHKDWIKAVEETINDSFHNEINKLLK